MRLGRHDHLVGDLVERWRGEQKCYQTYCTIIIIYCLLLFSMILPSKIVVDGWGDDILWIPLRRHGLFVGTGDEQGDETQDKRPRGLQPQSHKDAELTCQLTGMRPSGRCHTCEPSVWPQGI